MKKKTTRRKNQEENLFNYAYNIPGSIPGTLKIEADAPASEIILINYNQDRCIHRNDLTPENCTSYLEKDSVSWLDVLGLGSEDTLRQLGRVFNLHPLLLEDIVNVPQRAKIEEYEDQLLIITQMVMPKKKGEGFWLEQVSLVLGKDYLLTVQEEPERDCFDRVRDRLRRNKGIIRQRGADVLAYALWDAIIDGFFPVLETYGDLIEELEEEVVQQPTQDTLTKIYQIRRELLALRRAIWPQRDAINILIRDGNTLMSSDIHLYLRDCYDHAVQIIDIIETYRELTSSLMDVYLSAVSNKMNEVMKVLTVIATIFIPLTFVAGIYGMNFDPETSPLNMPELNWYWGYPLCLGLMIAIGASLGYFFWRRGWFKA